MSKERTEFFKQFEEESSKVVNNMLDYIEYCKEELDLTWVQIGNLAGMSGFKTYFDNWRKFGNCRYSFILAMIHIENELEKMMDLL
jgi:hypothetical protein